MGQRGPTPKNPDDLRGVRVSVYFSADELAELDRLRGGIGRGRWLRNAGLNQAPRSVPAINREAWSSLSKTVANLNQYQAAINAGKAHGYPPSEIQALADYVRKLRNELIGVSSDEAED